MATKTFEQLRTDKEKWHEGVGFVGYWKEGDSFVFRHNGHYFCISNYFMCEAMEAKH